MNIKRLLPLLSVALLITGCGKNTTTDDTAPASSQEISVEEVQQTKEPESEEAAADEIVKFCPDSFHNLFCPSDTSPASCPCSYVMI